MQLAEQINQKWSPVLDHPDLPEIKDAHRRAVTALCLENVERQAMQDKTVTGLLSEAQGDNPPATAMSLTTAGDLPERQEIQLTQASILQTQFLSAWFAVQCHNLSLMIFVVYNQCLDLLDLFSHYVLV